MVPAIFSQMEQAEDSDGFDSCEEDLTDNGRSGNPFKDFALEIKDIEDEEVKFTLTIARKQIVDWIEVGKDCDLDGWKSFTLKNIKKEKMQAWSSTS